MINFQQKLYLHLTLYQGTVKVLICQKLYGLIYKKMHGSVFVYMKIIGTFIFWT